MSQFPLANTASGHEPRKDELRVGDMVVYIGKETEYSLKRRVIYRVVERKVSDGDYVSYKYRPVFDFENPVGMMMKVDSYSSTGDVKVLSLIDLGIIRMVFDGLIRERAKELGMEDASP